MENKNIKHIIREMPYDGADLSLYFEDDWTNGKAGEKDAEIYCVYRDYGRWRGLNDDDFNEIVQTADDLINDFDYVREDGVDSYKRVMELYCIKYNPRRCHELKEWSLRANTDKIEDIAEYLTITTGKRWSTLTARGYYQGDYCEVLYCEAHHHESTAQTYGDVFCGAAKEFLVIDLDENGEEIDECGGYIIADCQIEKWGSRAETYKQLVCEWAGIDKETTCLELIENYHTQTIYDYSRVL